MPPKPEHPAVLWAKARGIFDPSVNPSKPVTFEELAVVLWRYSGLFSLPVRGRLCVKT